MYAAGTTGVLNILNAAVSLLVRAALLAARFSGQVRKQSLKRSSAARPRMWHLYTSDTSN
jgi:hypothetical protein